VSLRALGIGVAVALALVFGLWVGALLFLPDAPRAALAETAKLAAPAPQPAASASPFVPTVLLAMPVEGVARAALSDNWGDPRDNGLRQHHGTDIMAPAMTAVRAAAPGIIAKLWNSAAGGTTIYERSPQRRWIYYYAHLAGYAPGLHEGQQVRTGDLLGYVGDTGNAGAGNYHLHFGLTRTTPEQGWWQGTDVDPFPYLAGRPADR